MEQTPNRFSVDRRKLFWYFLLPLLVVAVLQAMYFSGVRLLETIVAAPYMDVANHNSRREFGLLENLQNLLLLGVVAVAAWAVVRHPERAVKVFMGFVTLAATVLLLEEIDYGLNFYEYLAGVKQEDLAKSRNLHNVGRRTAAIKSAGTAGAVVVFGILPFLPLPASLRRTDGRGAWARLARWLRYFTPNRYMALMLVVMLLTRTVAHELDSRGYGHGLSGNMAEFRELVMYYIGLAYTVLLARRRVDVKGDEASVAEGGYRLTGS